LKDDDVETVVEPNPSSNPFIRPRKTIDKAKILPDLSMLSLFNVPDFPSHMDISSKAPSPLFRPQKTLDMSPALEHNSDAVMGPMLAAELTSATISSPITILTVLHQQKTADQLKVLPRLRTSSNPPHISSDMDVIMSPSTANISHVEMAHPSVAHPTVFCQ